MVEIQLIPRPPDHRRLDRMREHAQIHLAASPVFAHGNLPLLPALERAALRRDGGLQPRRTHGGGKQVVELYRAAVDVRLPLAGVFHNQRHIGTAVVEIGPLPQQVVVADHIPVVG